MMKKAKPAAHGEHKKAGQIMLTPSAWDMLNQKADSMGLSRSELIERMARGTVHPDPELEALGELPAS